MWDATWPVLLGLGIGAVFLRWPLGHRVRRAAERALPPGDLLVPVERAAVASARGIRRAATALAVMQGSVSEWARALGRSVGYRIEDATGVVETTLVRWRASGVTILAVLAALLVLAMGGV